MGGRIFGSFMNTYLRRQKVFLFILYTLALSVWHSEKIPRAAWKYPIGQPLENADTKRPALDAGHIYDGFRQGVPTDGFGAQTFSRTFRGDFEWWHFKTSVLEHRKVNANEFAMFQQTEGTATGTARVLFTDQPSGGQLSSWDWDYPLGHSYALYPKSWFDFRREKFVVEQFSPVLPDNYRESGFPVAVYRWHAENPATQTVTVSNLCSWTNMLGWPRTFSRDFRRARGGS